MIKLNDDNVSIGQIKQLLKCFNLPTCPVGESNKEVNKHYIHNNKIYLYKSWDVQKNGVITTETQDIPISDYIFNHFYENLTSNLKIENNLYDRYTHRYLGKYLRFIRDYKNVDLMSMYNCFDGEVFKKSFTFALNASEEQNNNSAANSFKYFTSNNNYVTYSIPLSLNKIYIVNLLCETPIEGCLYINNSFLTSNNINVVKQIARKSYFKKTFYTTPYKLDIFSKFETETELKQVLQSYNQDLILLLKVPFNLTSSISIIEKWHSEDITQIPAASLIHLQLFDYTNDKNYLLADKLIEYLTGNVICPLSKDYDIEKVQRCLNKLPTEFLKEPFKNFDSQYLNSSYYGNWSDYDTTRIWRFIIEKKLYISYFDLLGYCDKDIEKELNIEISRLEAAENIKIGGII